MTAALLVATVILAGAPGATIQPLVHAEKNPTPSAAYQWLEISLEATAREVDRNGARPTILSRTLAIPLTAMYDAWAAYDAKAVGTRSGGKLRRPAGERTQANKEKAIAFATYRGLLYVYPDDAEWIRGEMKRMGFDPDDASLDATKPSGIGNLAAKAVVDYRRGDGANQHADEAGGSKKPYSDYTFYRPVNTLDKVVDLDRWQPIPFSDGRGGTFAPGFLTPHWYRVKTLALDAPDQFRPPPPPEAGREQMEKEVEEVIRFNGTLTDEQRAVVEFMRDGPRSTGQSGHWLRFAQDVSRRDKHGLDQDVKLFFAIANVCMDAFIAAWDAKRAYDSSRPWTLIRTGKSAAEIQGWNGPQQGFGKRKASDWIPYSPSTFVTPPFPGYVSGHSTVSAAAAKTLELYTGSDRFGFVEHRVPGSLTDDAGDGAKPVSLQLPTFTATAEMAGISRVMGGYHIQSDNTAGLELGRKVAIFSWPKYQAYFDGTAAVRE